MSLGYLNTKWLFFVWNILSLYNLTMADDSDEEHIGEEQLKEEEALPQKPRKIFINHVDSYHGKNIARVSCCSKQFWYYEI